MIIWKYRIVWKFLRIIRQTIVDEGDLLGGTGRSCHAHRKQSVHDVNSPVYVF